MIGNNVIIEWKAPNANGSPITSYRITIKQRDGTFTEDLTHCDGQNSFIVTFKSCTIPLLILQTSPYNLQLGDSIIAKATCSNVYGESAFSDAGNGAIIL